MQPRVGLDLRSSELELALAMTLRFEMTSSTGAAGASHDSPRTPNVHI